MSASAEPLSLGKAYAMAVARSDELRAAEERLTQAQQEERRVISTVLPHLTLSAEFRRRSESEFAGGDYTDNLARAAQLDQALYSGGKNRAGLAVAKQQTASARTDIRFTREEFLFQVANVYYSVLRTRTSVEIQTRNVERLREHRRLAELRFKVGEVTQPVLLRAESELASALAELAALNRDAAVAVRELQLLTGSPETVAVVDPLEPHIPAEPSIDLRHIAQSEREDLRRSLIQERIAEHRVSVERADFLPTINLEGRVARNAQSPEKLFHVGTEWFIGARLDLPIFEGGLRLAELRQASSRLQESRYTTATLQRTVDLEITRAELTLEAVTLALTSRQEQLRFAKKNYEMVSKQFTFGLATNLDVLDANQTLIEAERDVSAAGYDRHLAILELQRSVGRFLPEAEAQMPNEAL